jgi:UDP-2,3-diacylglucosamine pyrophosphatase LpxH
MTHFTRLSVKSLFIADAHLGAPNSPALALGHLLDRTAVSEGIYILGDLIDSRALPSGAALPPAHAEVIDRLQVSAANGVPVIYIPGDRDGRLRSWLGNRGAADCDVGYCAELDGLKLQERGWYTDGEGRRHLLVHGDEREPEGTHRQGWVRNAFARVQTAVGLAEDDTDGFVRRKLALAAAWRADGIICGHDPHSASRVGGGRFYRNPGHWAERQTAMIETDDGRFVHLNWGDVLQQLKNRSPCEVFGGLAHHLDLKLEKVTVAVHRHNALGSIPDRPPPVGTAKLLAALRYTG